MMIMTFFSRRDDNDSYDDDDDDYDDDIDDVVKDIPNKPTSTAATLGAAAITAPTAAKHPGVPIWPRG